MPVELEKILARLNAKTPSFETHSKVNDPLQPSDIAGALAFVGDKMAVALLLIKGTGNWSEYQWLEDNLCELVLGWAIDEGWRDTPVNRADMVLRMVRLALMEELEPRRCRLCRGRGEQHPRNAPVKTCEKCGGTGVKPYSERGRARACGLRWGQWRFYWAVRHRRIRSHIGQLDELGRRRLRRALR